MIILKVILAILLVASTGLQVHAMEHYTNTATDQYGKVVGGAQVSVYLAGTSTLATIYSDNLLTAKSNPFLTSVTSGVVDFYAANGAYDLVLTAAGKTFTANDTKRITLFDYEDLAVTALPASPFDGQLVIVLDDVASGDCASAGGSALSLCMWDGASWITAGSGGGGGVTGWPTVSTTKEITWADAFANAALFGNGTNKWALYNDPTDGLQLVCVIAGVANDCNYVRKLASGKTFEVRDSFGAGIFTLDEATGVATNVQINAESSGNTLTIKRYKWFPAAGCNNVTASTIWDLPASNPAVAACRTGTNTTKGVLEFADGSDLSAQLTEYLFEDWTGQIDATIVYEANSTSTNNVVWQLAIACAGNTDSDDPAFTYDEFSADAGLSTAHQYNMTAANTITTTGTCTAGDIMHMSVRRNSGHASDTLAATAKLVGVALKLRESQ